MTKATTTRRVVAVAALAVVLGLLAACAPPVGKVAVRQGPNSPRVWDGSDPAVLVWEGKTYLFGSTNNKKAPVRQVSSFGASLADSQTQWGRDARDAMPTRPAWVDPSEWQIWAPSVIKLGERFVMYFASMRAGAVDEHNDQCIGRAEATSPAGPYTPGSAPIYCGLPREAGSNPWGRGALDPEVFRGPDRKLYLLVTLARTGDNIGSLPLDSVGRVIGGVNAVPRTLASQRYPWHDGVDDSVLRGVTVLENPSMIYEPRTKTYLLFYSAGHWQNAQYVTGFARCSTPTGPCTMDARGPFLKSGNGRSGTGGLTAFVDAGGTMRVAYASWTAGHEGEVGTDGRYSRQVHWATLSVSTTTDPANQTVRLS